MIEMNFNSHAFVAPKNKQEYIALLDEAIRMGEELNEMWKEAFSYTQPQAPLKA